MQTQSVGWDEASWAVSEFGEAKLGNQLRTARLVAMARQAAQTPACAVTSVFLEPASREGAFRLLENDRVAPEAMMHAAHRAGARRCAAEPFAYVPVDPSSLNLVDGTGHKGFGALGRSLDRAYGLQVMTAIGLSPDGTPQGVVAQSFWCRARGKKKRQKERDKQQTIGKETQRWLDAMQQAQSCFAEVAPTTRPWFQLDRGADAWPILMHSRDPKIWLTVRACADRRLWTEPQAPAQYLWATVLRQEPLGSFLLQVAGKKGRAARQACMQLRACQVTLDIRDKRTNQHHALPMWAVHAVEQGSTPVGERPLQWMLLTSYPVKSLEDAAQVTMGYAYRWRIEEFHKTWKTGACCVEGTQLRAVDHVVRWAIVLASVAMRIQRMMYLSRTEPEQAATVEFTQAEIDATIVARKPKGYRRGDVPQLVEVVRWIADQGGYTGKSSGGPPGAKVLARGLERLQVLFRLFAENAATAEDKR